MRKLIYTNPLGDSIELSVNPYLIESLEGIELAPLNVQSTRAPVQDGSTYIDALLANREIVVRGSINAPQDFTDIYNKRRAMQSVLNPKLGKGELLVVVGGAPDVIRKCKNVVVSSVKFSNKVFQNPYQDFQVQFECLDPFMYENVTVTQSAISGALTTINNYGDSETPVTISLVGGTNPTITNQTTGESISFTYFGGGTIIVTTEFGNKTAKIGASSVMGNLTLGSVFWNLAVGTNSILLTGGGTATISWSPRYIGV